MFRTPRIPEKDRRDGYRFEYARRPAYRIGEDDDRNTRRRLQAREVSRGEGACDGPDQTADHPALRELQGPPGLPSESPCGPDGRDRAEGKDRALGHGEAALRYAADCLQRREESTRFAEGPRARGLRRSSQVRERLLLHPARKTLC